MIASLFEARLGVTDEPVKLAAVGVPVPQNTQAQGLRPALILVRDRIDIGSASLCASQVCTNSATPAAKTAGYAFPRRAQF